MSALGSQVDPSEGSQTVDACLLRLPTYDGRGLSPGRVLYGALTGSSAEIETLDPRLSRYGKDHCVYSARLSADALGGWEIWTTAEGISAKLRRPSGAQIQDFRDRGQSCVERGDSGCIRPELLAVSDLDADGDMEYWQTMPLTWDVGLQVEEGALAY